MPGTIPITIPSPLIFAVFVGLALLVAALAIIRGARQPRSAWACVVAGLLLLAAAAAGVSFQGPASDGIVVMVDLSASSRGADYRDPAVLRRRIGQLVGDRPFRIVQFSQTNRDAAIDSPLSDWPGDRTIFAPPPADAIVLFSDGRFELPPAVPPVYVALDPALQDVPDASVQQIEARGNEIAVTTESNQPGRILRIESNGVATTRPVALGRTVYTTPLPSTAASQPAATGTGRVTAELSGGDLWPENDSLSLPLSAPLHSQRWWVGSAAAPGPQWRVFAPGDLPVESADYLAPSVIVLNDVAATDLSSQRMDRLEQYVRDLGGAVLIVGGRHAFGAGLYSGTALDRLSPLASDPPGPATRWMLLTDSSGSMAAAATGGGTLWQRATAALVGILPALPPADLADVGGFAANLNWWSSGHSAAETAATPLPPAAAAPGGPTNLEPVLQEIAAHADAALPTNLLLLTDAETKIDQPALLADRLRAGRVRLWILAIAPGSGLADLRQMAATTGGQVIEQSDPTRWPAAARQFLSGARSDAVVDNPLAVRFIDDAANLPARDVMPWDRTWLRPGAAPLASATADSQPLHPVARWNVGNGRVIAVSFAATAAECDSLANRIAQGPRDPRLKIIWDVGSPLRVTIDAVDAGQYMNGLHLSLRIDDADSPGSAANVPTPIDQAGPGRYEITLPAPRRLSLAAILLDGAAVDRTALPGRYASEFDAVGNDRGQLETLAKISGGAVIEPNQITPIDFNLPHRDVPLLPWLASAGAALICVGLIIWKRQ